MSFTAGLVLQIKIVKGNLKQNLIQILQGYFAGVRLV